MQTFPHFAAGTPNSFSPSTPFDNRLKSCAIDSAPNMAPKRTPMLPRSSFLRQLKPINLEPTRVLGRGHQNFDGIIAQYPMLALTLIEPNLATAIQQVHAKMIKDREYLTQLKT